MEERIDSSYLYDVFGTKTFSKLVDDAVFNLKLFEAQTPFEAIAFTGMSGSAVAYPLSYLLKKPLLCVRKKDISAHSVNPVEGVVSAKTYVIVDDCIDSGATVDRIRKCISEGWYTKTAKLVGIYLYNASEFRNNEWKRKPGNEDVKIIDRAFAKSW